MGEDLGAPLEAEHDLHYALTRTNPQAPVVALIHGFRFSPALDQTSPRIALAGI